MNKMDSPIDNITIPTTFGIILIKIDPRSSLSGVIILSAISPKYFPPLARKIIVSATKATKITKKNTKQNISVHVLSLLGPVLKF